MAVNNTSSRLLAADPIEYRQRTNNHVNLIPLFFMEIKNDWKHCHECIHWVQRGSKSSEYFCPYAKITVYESTDADECVASGLFSPASGHVRR